MQQVVESTEESGTTSACWRGENRIEVFTSTFFFQVWLCLGSDNMALPMDGLEDAHDQINQSIQFDQVVSEHKHTQRHSDTHTHTLRAYTHRHIHK